MGAANPLNATSLKPVVNDLIDAIDRNTAALMTLAAITALGRTGIPPQTETTVAAYVRDIAKNFAKP
jgi:hypothetical protein